MRWALLVVALLAVSAAADDAGSDVDAGPDLDAGSDDAGLVLGDAGRLQVPDASVDQGGAGRMSEEADSSNGACRVDTDCERGFVCRGGTCSYQRFRDATYSGCGGGAVGLVAVALALTLSSRTSRSSSSRRRRAGRR